MVSRRYVVRSAFVAALIAAVGGFVLGMCYRINELFWRVAVGLGGDVAIVGDFVQLLCLVGVVSFAVGGFLSMTPDLVLEVIDRRRAK